MSRATITRSALALAVLLTATACAGPGDDEQATVVVTTNILGDITENIVGDQAQVSVLMAPNSDPHSFGISAQQAAAMERAGLLVYNGLGLEEGVLRNVEAAAEAGVATVEVGAAVDPIDYTSDESEGQPDPHFWTDPARVAEAVDLIADQVIDNVPGVDESTIRDNADRYRGEVEDLDATMADRFAEIPEQHRRLVTNHHVFGYLAERYDFEVIGAVIPSGTTLASPSASDLESLANTIGEAGVPAIFADSSQSDRLAQVLAEQAGIDVAVVSLYSESLSAEGGGAASYLEMMRANSDSIADGLLGQD
ncbi:zinc ABC transporter substrate-binding protein AztC [Actinoalloteichus hymeniacidonis]|uniref:ABC-type metal ion transport system, periplasmic component/surface adhesin n=1 Tax=Actinoalloteichus hymeniacidonis TaxID=340345 RepID=A0AAC9N014_9PSEU|nr:zinc ABC transporter substrate-binding protein AztC [Actinoalloteichus hymeniacidonis]AOS64607.1 ABC-type metal ion transport system, periplasmic component/surface adhesin [Actinoalloteichus hymeniacidonis]MBB5907320.1 zinc/manganese transport system substrate-binding protein [Actinoalloteichus hymeniacidonis]